MYNLKINDEVIWIDKEGKKINEGVITDVKFTSPLGNIYRVLLNGKSKESEFKNIHQSHLRKK